MHLKSISFPSLFLVGPAHLPFYFSLFPFFPCSPAHSLPSFSSLPPLPRAAHQPPRPSSPRAARSSLLPLLLPLTAGAHPPGSSPTSSQAQARGRVRPPVQRRSAARRLGPARLGAAAPLFKSPTRAPEVKSADFSLKEKLAETVSVYKQKRLADLSSPGVKSADMGRNVKSTVL
jgi:hypothetical protein